MVTVLDFYADWCGPCKQLEPEIDALDEEYDDVEFTKVDVDANQDKANEYNVRSLPTVIVLDDDDEVADRFVGVVAKDAIANGIDAA